MMADRRINIVYESDLKCFADDDESFDRGILRVAYTGKNRNGSFISKETFEKCINTIYNKPIVCHYIRESDSIGSHDIEIVQAKDDSLKIVNVTQPVGVVPESANYWWEEIEEKNGDIHEYLCCDILIWKREEAYEHIKANKITDESMEIRVKSGHTADGLFHIDSFEFTAFCLLESADPCYESASIEVFSLTEFRDLYLKMMEDLTRQFQSVTTSKGDDINPHNTTNLSKGGDTPLNKTEILEQFGLTPETVPFNIDDLNEDELRSKLQELENHKFDDDPDGGENNESGEADPESPEDDGDDDTAKTKGQFSLTAEQFRDELDKALCAVTYVDRWMDEYPRYSYVDYDPETNEVYCYDRQERWTLYGFGYSLSGDTIVIDFESKKRKKISIVDFEEGSAAQNYQDSFADYCEKLSEKKDGETAAVKAEDEKKFAELNAQIKALQEYQDEKLNAERQEAEAALFQEFSELDGIEAFEALKSNCADMTLEEVESKCFEIKGRNDKVITFAANRPKPVRLPAGRPNTTARTDDNEPYGGIFLEYGSRT